MPLRTSFGIGSSATWDPGQLARSNRNVTGRRPWLRGLRVASKAAARGFSTLEVVEGGKGRTTPPGIPGAEKAGATQIVAPEVDALSGTIPLIAIT